MASFDGMVPPSAMVSAVGVDHVSLSYLYLDSGDLDGYASLLDGDVQLNRPDLPHAQGRVETVRVLTMVAGPPCRHNLYKVVGADDCVTATGRVNAQSAYPFPDHRIDVEFADIFTISDDGLLLGIRRFYYVPPAELLLHPGAPALLPGSESSGTE